MYCMSSPFCLAVLPAPRLWNHSQEATITKVYNLPDILTHPLIMVTGSSTGTTPLLILTMLDTDLRARSNGLSALSQN